ACILVRVDKSRIERFQFYSGEKALESFRRRTGRSRGRCVFDRMVVEGRLRVAFQHPALEPVAQGRCGAGISIMSWTVAWLIEPQFESNDILWMAIVQSLLPSRIDDVVGRRHDLFDIPYNRRIVPRAMKRNDLGHGGSLPPSVVQGGGGTLKSPARLHETKRVTRETCERGAAWTDWVPT